jgi:hypothetical protein
MKLFASVCAGTVMAAGIAAVPARAQVIEAQVIEAQVLPVQTVQARIIQVADVLRSDGYDRGAYVGPPEPVPMGDDTVILAPDEIPGILRQQGFSQLGPVFRRGWVYTVAVLNQNGDDGRLIVDARTGEPIRFIPAMRMDSRLRDELDRMYGPPGPPPARFAQPYDRGPSHRVYPPRTASHAPVASPRHAAPLKRAAKAIAKTAPKPNPAAAAAASPKTQTPAAHTAQLSGTSGAAPKDVPKSEVKPAAKPEAKPATDASTVELKPTGPMPPVQPMD